MDNLEILVGTDALTRKNIVRFLALQYVSPQRNSARLTNTRLMAAGHSRGFYGQFRASQAVGVSSAIRLIGKLANPGKTEAR